MYDDHVVTVYDLQLLMCICYQNWPTTLPLNWAIRQGLHTHVNHKSL